jgi:hypothetical protein
MEEMKKFRVIILLMGHVKKYSERLMGYQTPCKNKNIWKTVESISGSTVTMPH